MKKIVFTHTGHSHALGNFEAGGVASVPDELADHFVNDAGCAVYADEVPKGDVQAAAQKPAKPAKPAKKGAQ